MLTRLFAISALALALTVSAQSRANELDNEASVTNAQIAAAKDLPATLVIRTNEATKEVEVLHSNDRIPADASTVDAVSKAKFMKMDVKSSKPVGELDRDSSSSSWYFCWPNANVYAPSYYYYGYSYNYSQYYSYAYAGYSYSYYRWGYGWGY